MKNMKFWRTALVATLVLTVMLSVTGGTIAWFTDTVTTGENTIKSGNLDLALEYKTNLNDAWAPVTETTKLFKEEALYEPGYTEVVFLRVVNAGNLALKYIMGVDVVNTAIGESVEGNAIELSDYMQIGAHVMDESLGQYLLPGMFDTREEAISYISGVDGTGFIDLNDEDTVLVLDEDPQRVLPEKNYAQLIALVLHMPTTVGNEANHVTGTTVPQMDITLNFEATQAMKEEDSFNNAKYDEDALFPSEIGTAADLKAALQAGENVKLGADIDLGDEQIKIPAGADVTIDLNGHDITQQKTQTGAYAMIENEGTLTIMDSVGTGVISYEDITPYTADPGWASNTIRNEGVLNIKGGTVENITSEEVMSFGYPHAIDVYQGSVTNISGGTVKSLNYDSIRMFCNSDTLKTEVNISGGHIINRVSFQDPQTNRPGYGVLNITGGTFTTTDEVNANVRLLNFCKNSSNMKATISGGTFDKGVKTQDIAGAGITQDSWLTISDSVTVNTVQ